MTEDQLQAKNYLWFHNNFPQLRGLLFHVPNGGNRSQREGSKFRAMGVVAGVLDFLFLWNETVYFIELKIEKGRLSDAQKNFIELVERHGYLTYIVREESSFKALILAIMSNIATVVGVKASLEYTHRIYMMLFDLEPGNVFNIETGVAEANREKFLDRVKMFIDNKYDVLAGFEIKINEDYTKLTKKML